MLVLTRRPNESIVISNNIKITVVSVGPGRVKLGIEAPPNVRVDRQEIHDKIDQEHGTDVLAVVGESHTHDALNTAVVNGPDTAMIVNATPAAEPAPVAPPALPLNKLSKYRLPRKSR